MLMGCLWPVRWEPGASALMVLLVVFDFTQHGEQFIESQIRQRRSLKSAESSLDLFRAA